MGASDAAPLASSEYSKTSTEIFDNEPFSSFFAKIVKICKKEWPDLTTEAFEVTHMDGGSYHRVTGVKVD
jgi:hypothetical protein